MSERWNYWYAVSVLVGTIIGVGVFGLPYVASQAGFFTELLYLATFLFAFIALHLMFAEVILRTNAKHNLMGYATVYLGKWSQRALIIVDIAGMIGMMMLYLIVGSQFLRMVSDGIFAHPWEGIVFFWFVSNCVVLLGIRAVQRSEMLMFFGILIATSVLCFVGIPKIQVANFLHNDIKHVLSPYGVTLFALAGTAAIPALRGILSGMERRIKGAIIWGTSLSAVIYALFVIVVLGVSGSATTENALVGMEAFLGGPVVFFGALFGVVVLASSFIMHAVYLKESLIYDLKIKPVFAIALTVLAPLGLALIQSSGFIAVMNFLGAVFGGLWSLFLIALYKKAQTMGDRTPEYAMHFSPAVLNLLGVFFIIGIVYAIVP